MNDYISRQAAIEVLCDACGNAACPKGMIPRCSYYDRMQSIPAADVQPVKRGRWFLRGGNWCCSVCKRKTLLTLESNIGGCKEYGTVKTDYCPNCGAKMESEDK